jgi:hypothetical protein
LPDVIYCDAHPARMRRAITPIANPFIQHPLVKNKILNIKNKYSSRLLPTVLISVIQLDLISIPFFLSPPSHLYNFIINNTYVKN